jgi:hypothetical protein
MMRIVPIAACALLAVGCGGADHATTYDVSGVVTQRGSPVAGATVSFLPGSSSEGVKSARGTTDEAGRFELKTYFGPESDVAGALPGDYRVTITKTPASSGIVDPYAGPIPQNELPARFADPQQSGLKATVTVDGENAFPFDVGQ